MMRPLLALAAAAGVMTAVPVAHGGHGNDEGGGVGSFRQVGTFNVPGATSAEIVSATRDGKYLVYSDAIGRRFGLVDIRDPRRPQQIGVLDAGGDPTSVAVLPAGNLAVACVQPGKFILIDLATFTKVAERTIGTGPDSVAVTRIGDQLVAVIAIENEGPLGKGYVEVVRLNLADFANSPIATVTFNDEAALTAAGLLAVADPQPEFVSIRGTKVAVTLQENNGIAVIDISNPAAPFLEELFSAGVIGNRAADLSDIRALRSPRPIQPTSSRPFPTPARESLTRLPGSATGRLCLPPTRVRPTSRAGEGGARTRPAARYSSTTGEISRRQPCSSATIPMADPTRKASRRNRWSSTSTARVSSCS